MKNIEHECCKALVSKFIECPNWPKELKIAKALLLKCQDLDSWLNLNLPNRILSLAFFLTADGQQFVPTSQKNPYLLEIDKLQPKKKKIEFTVE